MPIKWKMVEIELSSVHPRNGNAAHMSCLFEKLYQLEQMSQKSHVKEQNMRQPKKHESKLWFTEAKKQP